MCDGMAHCSFRVLNSTLHENKLLWQRATDEDFLLPTSSPLALTVERESDYSNAAEADVVDGNTIFARMAPWITYTYPLVVHFKEVGVPSHQVHAARFDIDQTLPNWHSQAAYINSRDEGATPKGPCV